MLYLLALCMAAESFSLVNEACQNVISFAFTLTEATKAQLSFLNV